MSKVWIVCQVKEGQKPQKVLAFFQKDKAADDCAARIKAAPDSVSFWLESVELAELAP